MITGERGRRIRGGSDERRVDDTFDASGDRRVHGRYVPLYPIGRLVYGNYKERVNAGEGLMHRGPIVVRRLDDLHLGEVGGAPAIEDDQPGALPRARDAWCHAPPNGAGSVGGRERG